MPTGHTAPLPLSTWDRDTLGVGRLRGAVSRNGTACVRLVHDHVNLLRSALVTAQPPYQVPHPEIRAEPLSER